MLRLFSKPNDGTEGTPAAQPADPQKQLDKLREYRDVIKEYLERAYERDVGGEQAVAAKLYRATLQPIYEALQLQVPSPGLDPAHSNVAKWRSELNTWQQLVLDRLRDLESPTASTSQPAPPPRHRIPGAPPTRSSSKGAGHTAAPAQRPAAAAALTAGPRLGSPRTNGALRPAGGPSAQQRGALGAAPRLSAAASREEQVYEDRILSEVLDQRPSVTWDDVAGLPVAKKALEEMVILPTKRADLFTGLRAPARGLLLYGPPGNGKTMLAKALANEARATFFNISAASLTSKWHGDAEKMVRALFRVAAKLQPAIIFIDEIDSILSERSSAEHEASRRLKTEFLVQFDGVAGGADRVVVLGATNRPWELDDAVRRRLPKRVYVPLPDAAGRQAIIEHLLRSQPSKLSRWDLQRIVGGTEGYSGSDLAALCKEAAMEPLRELGRDIETVPAEQVRSVGVQDFKAALQSIKPSVSRDQLRRFEQWTADFGTPS